MITILQLYDGTNRHSRIDIVRFLPLNFSALIHNHTILDIKRISEHSRLVTLCLVGPFSFQPLIILFYGRF
ncbi:hypothetical protein BDV32DRAFT_132800 [Aspergillus pseudonomiae]|nr:hypothetical protein BDV32DRAFT_132800 [Aspergillus pseudonomiae]